MMDLTETLRKAEAWLDEIDGVEGVAEGEFEGRPCITVFVSTNKALSKIPDEFLGFKVAVEMTEAIRPLD